MGVPTKDAVERFSHPSHRFRVPSGFLWCICQVLVHILSQMQNHIQNPRDNAIYQTLNPPPHSFPVLGLLGGNILEQLLQARSVKSHLYSIHHFHSLNVDQVVFAHKEGARTTVVEWSVPR